MIQLYRSLKCKEWKQKPYFVVGSKGSFNEYSQKE